MRFFVAASVTVCVYSCRSTVAQLYVPNVLRLGSDVGATMTITVPVDAPTVPIQPFPVMRIEKSWCVGKNSTIVFSVGSYW